MPNRPRVTGFVPAVAVLACVLGSTVAPAASAEAPSEPCLQESFVPSPTGGLHTIVECSWERPEVDPADPWSGPMDDTDGLPPVRTEEGAADPPLERQAGDNGEPALTASPTTSELATPTGSETGTDDNASSATAVGHVAEGATTSPNVPNTGQPDSEVDIAHVVTRKCGSCLGHGERGSIHAAVDRAQSGVDAVRRMVRI